MCVRVRVQRGVHQGLAKPGRVPIKICVGREGSKLSFGENRLEPVESGSSETEPVGSPSVSVGGQNQTRNSL